MAETITKATHEKVELFAPFMKDVEGKYIAVLSDTSIDRDGERVGKSALTKIDSDGYVAGLMDHENKILNQVCAWINRRVVDSDGHTALIAEPKFFLSNPNAKIIKGMLDEGAEMGISIGAIVKEYEDEKINGKSMKTFTELELLEASFVAIPSNRHGRIVALAKSFGKSEEKQMTEKTYKQEDVDSAISEAEKKFETKVSELNKQLETKDAEIVKLQKTVEDNKAELDKATSAKEEADSAKEEADKALEEEKKKSLEKQKFADQGGDDNKEVDAEKAFSEGKLPIMRS